MKYVYNLL